MRFCLILEQYCLRLLINQSPKEHGLKADTAALADSDFLRATPAADLAATGANVWLRALVTD